MLRPGRILACVVLISVVALSSCAQEEDPYVTMYDPLVALTEKLQLTDEQVETVETGTGTLQLTAEQVNTISDPVEQLLNELEQLLDETRWEEVEDIFGTLLTKGEADLEALAGVAEELHGLDVAELEVVTKLEKLSGEVGSSEEKQPLTTGPLEVTTIYTPGGTPQEIDEGDEHINLGWTCEGKVGPGEPDSGATANSETGGLYAYSRSWIGSDGSTALLGIEFDVPADNTDVNITTTMKYITATTSVGAGFAGTYRATRFADESVCYTTIDPPFDWKKAVPIICSVIGMFVPVVGLGGALAQGGIYAVDTLNFVDLAQALSGMEGTEEKEITYSAGSLDRGRYRFYIGLHARTSAAVIGIAHAAAYGHVTQIKVTQDIPSFDLTITSTEGGEVTEPGEGIFTRWAGEEVDLVAEAEEGYSFVNWTGDVGTIGNINAATTTITMNGDYSITANFEAIAPTQYNLTISSTAGGSVTMPDEGTFTYDEGTVVNLVAEAEEGYHFVNWSGDVGTIADVNAAVTTITMNGDYSITANFYDTEIWDWHDLDAIRNNLGGSYILMNNLDSTTAGYAELASVTANEGEGWQPIGTLDDRFTGSLDGQGYEIGDLFINRPDASGVGLFGVVDGAGVIQNLGVVNADVTGYTAVGGLVGYNSGGTVSNSYSTGSVTSYATVGGLVGASFWDGSVSNSYSSASVTGEQGVGGLVGQNRGSLVITSYSSGSVNGDDLVGGLVGWNLGTVSKSYSSASVTGEYWHVGGLVGENYGTVSNSYSSGNVAGSSDVGGLVGQHSEGIVSNSYSTGRVTGLSNSGGLVGDNDYDYTTVSRSFWDRDTSGREWSQGGLRKTTTEMQDMTTFHWDITAVALGETDDAYIWNIVDGETYPFLSWQTPVQYTLTISSTAGGSVTAPSEGTFTYIKGTAVKLTAEAEEGYRFVDWTGDVGTIANVNSAITTITMNSNYSITANFEEIPKYNLTISSTAGGLVKTPGEGTFTYYEGTVVDLVAEVDEGYRFINWTGDIDTIGNVNDATTTITMNDQYSITANFEELFPGGRGTAQDPYQIANWHHLHDVQYCRDAHFILMNNLDSTTAGYAELAGVTANEGEGWQPIGTSDNPFYGTFDGRGYEIGDLFIHRPDEDLVGLFGQVGYSFTGAIKNLSVVNADVTGDRTVGSLVGYNNQGTVENCHCSGSVSGYDNVGGLVGYNIGPVSNSYSTGSVNGNWYVGGLVGWNDGTVSMSHFSGSVSGDRYVGGLVGENSYANVQDSYSTGNVDGGSRVGGLVGGNDAGTVSNSYSTASVTGTWYVGGLMGYSHYHCTVSNSHSTGSVDGTKYVGGLAGMNAGFLTNSYSSGSVTGDQYVGGLVGIHYGTVSKSYSSSSVTGSSYVGGLVGCVGVYYGTVSNSYSTASVAGSSYVGGLVGYNDGTVSNSYSTASVAGSSYVGGLVGYNEDTVSNSFWDTETSGQATSDGGTGKTTAEMQDIATFSGAGWNIIAVANPGTRNPSYIWNIVNGVTYPFLSWQSVV